MSKSSSDSPAGNGPEVAKSAAPLLDANGEPLPFEVALEELEGLVERMEGGELSLEDSVACFERGVALHRYCQQSLEQATQKVQILLGDQGDDLAPFDVPASDDQH